MSEEEKEAIKETKKKIESTQKGLKEGRYYGEQFNLEREIKREQILLNYIDKLEKSDKEWFDIADNILRATNKYGEISIGEVANYIDKLQKDLENLKEVERQICCEELITKDKYQDILKENAKLKQDNYNLDRENQLKFEKIIEENEELKKTRDELAKENEKWIDSGLDYVKRHFKDYIHKDRIRTKIEELEGSLDGCYQADEEVNASMSIEIYTELLIWLEELLGDDEQ